MNWTAYVTGWLAATIFWTLASATSARISPLETLPYGLAYMGSGAIMGVAVWHLTGRVTWDWRSRIFYVAHGASLLIYSVIYAVSPISLDLLWGRGLGALMELVRSPVLPWNLLIGSGVYLVVAVSSYAIRAQRRARAEEAAAAEARVLAQQAQLVALRAQLNPHFLFNALHSVGALVSNDPAQAEKAIECLGDLLRYALGTEDEVVFLQEWKFTQDYLAFEHLRLGDRLRVEAEADPAAMSVMVPPLILQPLVENAVRHGIADRPEGGRLDLRARVEDSRLVLRLKDDGRGESYVEGDGLGLSSVRRRLAALYGNRATVDVASRDEGFIVTIGLPVEQAGMGSAA